MKTTFTIKNRVIPQLLFLSSLVFLFSTNVFGSVKHTVNVTNYKFTPNELQIGVGDTVEWKNTQGFHNVNGTKTTFPTNPESFGNSTGSGWVFTHVFKTAGKYDYHCDPHFVGMVGKIEVTDAGVDDGKNELTINFTGMTPHAGQNIWLSLTDKDSGIEIERKKQIGSASFSVVFSGIEKEHSYNVDFFADHNKNGQYDAPPADHAWRLELNNVEGDTTLMFQHNTSFTNINWIATAISDQNISLLKMYPNPATDKVFIEVDKISGSDIQVSIYDLNGKLKYSALKPLINRIELDIQNLSNGIYFIELKTINKKSMFKLIKQ